MMHNLSHAGNTAICELEGSIGSSMLPTVRRNFRGVAGWRIPAVGYPPSPPSISGWSTNDIPYPGLSVAIAPHMTTWTDVIGGTDNRFQFINSLYSGNAQDNLPWNLHNPLSFNAPPQAFHANSGSDSYLSNPTHQLPAAPSDTAEARAACANPAVLTRNIFSSIILELASRHGMMRADTELLLVGTQNRDLTAVDRPPPRANFPALITPMNFDIAAQGFQLPFISYFSGNANITAGFPVTDRLSNSNTFALGFVNPFDTTGPAIDYSTLLSNQLRYCYHLYAPQTPPTNPPTSALARHAPLPRDASNQGFEDIFAFQDMIYPPGLRTAQANGATPWASPCPWNANMSTCIPANGARRLTAAEVAGSLGTIQSCPYPIANPITLTSCDKSLFLNDNNSTSNANRATLDLRPDLIGLLKYLAADSYAAATFPAIMPPGLFPYNFNAGAASGFTNTDYPFGNSTTFYAETPQRDAAGRSSSTILIILHQRINFNDIAIISPLVDALNTTDSNGDVHKRPITIAYFPTTAADADPTAIGNLVAAFNANIFGTDPKRNSLLIFSPDQLAGASAAFNSQLLATCLPTQTACRFQKYWHHLLSQPPTSADSIFFQARDVFQTRLVNKGILF
jgi:hypothetical protein